MQRSSLNVCRVTLLAAAVALCASFHLVQQNALAQAQPDGIVQSLERLEGRLKAGQATQSELNRLGRDLTLELSKLQKMILSVSQEAQSAETSVAHYQITLDQLEREAANTRENLADRSVEMASLAAALQKLSRRPPELLFLTNTPPLDAVRTGILLERMIPSLHDRMSSLKDQLNSLETLRAQIVQQRARLGEAAGQLESRRLQLSALVEEKRRLLQSTRQRQQGVNKQLEELVDSAKTLRDLLKYLTEQAAREREERRKLTALVPQSTTVNPAEDSAPRPTDTALALLPNLTSITSARGHLFVPVAGSLRRKFGQQDPEGLRDKGLLLASRSGAVVSAPFEGTIVYAGPFELFGNILIIDHGEGYHSLLSGLGQTSITTGQRVLAGEPVGIMGKNKADSSPNRASELYLELRHNGTPINPLPWFSRLSTKVGGKRK